MQKSDFVHVITDASVMVLNTSTGNQVKFFSDDHRYEKAIAFIKAGEYDDVFGLDTKVVIENFFDSEYDNVSVFIRDGEGFVRLNSFGGMIVPLHSSITTRMIKMEGQGFNCKPMTNFINRLYSNPDNTAINELYLFIEAAELPITEDGCFIAYKIVRDDYKDVYTGTMDNSIGNILSMPRNQVDSNRKNTCSHGLHFCSRSYLNSYASSNSRTDRCMLVKIDPADVVSIPSDYNNAKGRTWKYEVVGEVEGEWRKTLPERDFTDSAVMLDDEESYDYSDEYIEGYLDGYTDARADDIEDSDQVTLHYGVEYSEGYAAGVEDYDNGYSMKFRS